MANVTRPDWVYGDGGSVGGQAKVREASTDTAVAASQPEVRSANKKDDAAERISPAFWFGAGLIFVRFSMVGETLAYVTRHNFYLLYFFGIPAALALLVKGRIPVVLRQRPAIYWLCFAIWMTIAVPFSIWKGGSFGLAFGYWRAEIVTMLVVAGLTTNLRECKMLMGVLAAATCVSLIWTRIFLRAVGDTGRMSLDFGTIANSNDFAAVLLLALPFLVWFIMSGRPVLFRFIAIPAVAYGVYAVLGSGSRGALIGLALGLLFFLVAASGRQRVILLAASVVVVTIAVVALPDVVMNRLLSFSKDKAGASEEALASSRMREQLLKGAVQTTITHPMGYVPSPPQLISK